MENVAYIATLTHPFSARVKITKKINDKLDADPDLTMDGLLEYMIKDEEFIEEEKEIAKIVSDYMERAKNYVNKQIESGFLAIRLLDENGNYRKYKSGCYENIRGLENGIFILPTEKVLGGNPPYLEDRIYSEGHKRTPYKIIDIEAISS